MQTQSVLPQPATKHSKVLRTSTLKDVLASSSYRAVSVKPDQPVQNTPAPQEAICSFLLKAVKQWPPDSVLHEFKKIFIDPLENRNSYFQHALEEIILLGDEEEFKNILKEILLYIAQQLACC